MAAGAATLTSSGQSPVYGGCFCRFGRTLLLGTGSDDPRESRTSRLAVVQETFCATVTMLQTSIGGRGIFTPHSRHRLKRAVRPSVHRYSIARLRSSLHPISRSRCWFSRSIIRPRSAHSNGEARILTASNPAAIKASSARPISSRSRTAKIASLIPRSCAAVRATRASRSSWH
jgi:hypothetical protein